MKNYKQLYEELIEALKIMSNEYQVLNGQYVISKNVLDVFIQHYESELQSLESESEEEEDEESIDLSSPDYHLVCEKCGNDFWTKDAFNPICDKCKKQ